MQEIGEGGRRGRGCRRARYMHFSIADSDSLDVSRSSENILVSTPKQEGSKSPGFLGNLLSHKRSHSEGAIAKLNVKNRK